MSLEIRADGVHVDIEMGPEEQLLLGALPGVLATVESEDDPAHLRLYPVPYGDRAFDDEYRRLAVPEIERARDRDNVVLSAVLRRLEDGRTRLSRAEAAACVRAIGAARLAIAARHGFFEQSTFDRAQATPEGLIVGFLGLVQDDLITALEHTEEVTA